MQKRQTLILSRHFVTKNIFGFISREELELALKFLAKVGILLHFEDSRAGLNELYFIDPAWVCRTISDLIGSTRVRNHLEESGFITAEKLIDLILKPRNIPLSNCRD